jgi:hypothetical protein
MSVSLPAHSWWGFGHSQVCDTAYQLVKESTRREIDRLSTIEAEAHKLSSETFASSCSWADRIKKLEPATRTWHYLNSTSGDTKLKQLKRPSDGDLITALEKQMAVLGQPHADDVTRALALRWVAHLMGDLHQPMHLGYRDDLGGNKYRLVLPDALKAVLQEERRDYVSMHAVWDGYLLIYATSKYQLAMGKLITKPANLGPYTVDAWVSETLALLQTPTLRYATPNRPSVLTRKYLDDNVDIALQQVSRAAHRLAWILDTTLALN